MPLRPYQLDPGFNPEPTFPPDVPQPERAGGGLFQFGENWQNMQRDLSEASAVFGAAFELENDVKNGWELLTEPVWQRDPNFNLEANLKEADLWDEYRWNFLGVESADHFLYKARKIQRELAARQILAAAGPDGVVASFVAGAASPTVLLPFVGPGLKGAKAIATGLAWGAVGGAAQEIPLQLNQELRTLQDTAISVGFSTVVGGLLGGGIGYLNARLDTVADGMAVSPREPYRSPSEQIAAIETDIARLEAAQAANVEGRNVEIDEAIGVMRARQRELEIDNANLRENTAIEREVESSAIGQRSAAGADVVDNDAGGLASMLGIGERLTRLAGPVTAVLGQKLSPQGRRMMAQISTAGLRLEGNLVLSKGQFDDAGKLIPGTEGKIIGAIPSNEGGTLEGIIQSRRGDTLALIERGYENYSDYWFGSGNKPGAFRNTRAYTESLVQAKRSGKLNRRQFFEEVGKAMWAGDVHDIPEVAKTAKEFREYYDQLLEEAQSAGLIPEEISDASPDLSFLNRVYDTTAIQRNPNRFVELLSNHFKNVLQQDLQKMHDSWARAEGADTQRLEDMDLPLEQAQKLKADFQNELKALDDAENDEYVWLQQLINDKRSDMRQLSMERKKLEKELREGPQTLAVMRPLREKIDVLRSAREAAQNEVTRLETLGGPDLEARQLRRTELKRRIRNLNRSKYMVEERARAKYDKIDELEEANIASLERIIQQGNRAMKTLEKEDASFDAEFSKLHKAVVDAQNKTASLDEQINSLHEAAAKQKEAAAAEGNALKITDDTDEILSKLFAKEEKRQAAVDRFNEVSEDLDAFQNINWVERGRDDARAVVQDAMNEAVERVNRVNTARAKRIAKLEAQAEKFDSKAWEAKRAEVVERMRTRKEKVREKANDMGADNYDMVRGTANFDQRAKEIAELATDRITGINVRLAGFDAMADARGTELARTLSIDSQVLAREGFLVSDAEHLLHVYAQTLIPDIEIVNRLGAFAPDGERNLQFRELNEEMRATLQRAENDFRAKAAKEGKPVDEAKLGNLLAGIDKEYRGIRSNLDATIRRLRGNWGIPSNPDGFATRGVQVVLSLQALRFLGTVGLSSIPDVARPIMRYGLGRTMRAAWLPMISNWKAVKMSADEARRAFVAVESATAQRAFQLSELMHFARKRTKVEAGLEWATSKIGIAFGFAPWTDLMKTLSSMTLNMKMLDSIDLAVNGIKTDKKRLEAIDFLNSLGIGQDMQRRMWDEMQNGGGEKINGVWVPQTSRWTDKEAIKTYRAALYSEGAASIITPGVELPKVVNATLPGRLFFNLKSFALASTSKTLMAGLQQRDMAVLNGVFMSLALGALSFYLKAVIAGGAAEERMRNATWQQWADEALNASGILGALSIGQQISGNIPGLRNVTSFSGGTAARSSASGLVEDVAGPSADLAFTLASIMTGLDKPTRAQVHRVRQLLPAQNLFFLRRLFDQLENAIGDQFSLEGNRL